VSPFRLLSRRTPASCRIIIRRSALFCLAAGLVAAVAFPALAAAQRASPPPADTVTIYDTSGHSQANRPVSVPRAFRQGEIPKFASASVNGVALTTQTDVKNRWPDGSLKYAIVSFVIPEIPARRGVLVSFSNQASGNNTGFLTPEEMLSPDYDFDAVMQMKETTVRTVSARAMLSAHKFRYWLQGPVVTAAIIEDRSPERAFDQDFGDGSKALHPIFEAWFFPTSKKVDVGYTAENIWASSTAGKSMRDLSYALTLEAGAMTPAIKYSQPAFTHLGRTRWHKRFWIGADPPGIRIDHNFSYWTSTRVIPNWDTSIRVSKSLLESRGGLNGTTARIEGNDKGIGGYDKYLSAGGASDWIGLASLWDILYLYSMDDQMLRTSLGNADLAGRIPWNFREADSAAGTGRAFDTKGQVDTFGRVVSINARKRVTLSDLSETCGSAIGADKINTGAINEDGWITTRDHMPDVAYIPYLFTGRYYYLEALQMQAAFIVGWKLGCTSEYYNRQGDAGYLHDSQLRGDAWGLRTLVYAGFISPDGSPEKSYFEDKMMNNIAHWEGQHDIPLDLPGKQTHWDFGHTKYRDSRGISPLGFWEDRGTEFVQAPIKATAKGAASPWEENFLMSVLGMARQFGYPTGSLLQFGARRLINQVLNPATYPEYMEAYRYPTINAAGQWISSWSEYNTFFDYTPRRGQWQLEETVDHSYGFIAMAALSYMTGFSVDGYSGQAAWTYMKAHKAGQERLATDSPKWALLPAGAPQPELAENSQPQPQPPRQPQAQPQPQPQPQVQEAAPAIRENPVIKAESAVPQRPRSLPDSIGWFEVPDTHLQSVCPPNTGEYAFSSNCTNILAAWSGAIADTARNRMIIWGGGHNDYYGNELYSFDLNSLALTRLTNPSPLNPNHVCVTTLPDGKPNTRHTYGGLSYVRHADKMYVFGGIVACTSGGGENDTWTLDLKDLQWTRMDPHQGTKPRTINGVVLSDYDPNTKLVFMENTRDFYSYDLDKNNYATLAFDTTEVSYHMSAVIDPVRKLFIMFGGAADGTGGLKVFHIGPGGHRLEDWTSQATGCNALLSAGYPGLAYDPVQDAVVGWAGGKTVYLFHPATKACTAVNFPTGPGFGQTNGTHGRFRYFPALNVFVLVNDVNQNVYVLRLTPTPPKSGTAQ
jgi:hypothetical protein